MATIMLVSQWDIDTAVLLGINNASKMNEMIKCFIELMCWDDTIDLSATTLLSTQCRR